MNRRKTLILLCSLLAVAVAFWSSSDALAKKDKATKDQVYKKLGKVTPTEQKAAEKRAKDLGLAAGKLGFIDYPGINQGPGGIPHYFGPYGNWAFSPLPKGPVATVTLVDGGTGYTAPVVTIGDAYLPPCPAPIGSPTPACYTPADVTATVTAGAVTGFTIVGAGAGYVAPVVTSMVSAASEYQCSTPGFGAPFLTAVSVVDPPKQIATSGAVGRGGDSIRRSLEKSVTASRYVKGFPASYALHGPQLRRVTSKMSPAWSLIKSPA